MKIHYSFAARRAMAANENAPMMNSHLVNYALRGLGQCWLPNRGCWSHIYHLDGRAAPNESQPPSDVFYTLNVLLGMSRVPERPSEIDLSEVFYRNVARLSELPVPKYAFGMALWAGAELGLDLPAHVTGEIRKLLSDPLQWNTLRAQDLGMLLTGVVAQDRCGNCGWIGFSWPLFRFLKESFHSPSGLFYDAALGSRRRFASFATQVYLSIACYHYGASIGDTRALHMANTCVRRLLKLQGPHGEWPWFFDAASGRVLDFYEIYSVHQYGMAPALLEWAERYGVPGAHDALVRGFQWVLGDNQLGRSMLVPELSLSIRSQIRRHELTTKIPRVMRALKNAALRRSSGLIDSSGIGLRLECRSYELGWILWSFGRRSDLPELTAHPAFAEAPGCKEKLPHAVASAAMSVPERVAALREARLT
ncbi:hypothetical protein [Methylovirgula sp. 4M-Z18]|uniref:hypothetical protein n=1 Tax=Methylovirgula sp. 4M-Z18 TaxID=2293567 RepID=UPI0018F44E15|nr:hypothetical protein [Methylovirgula sp. 4M-Z18]